MGPVGGRRATGEGGIVLFWDGRDGMACFGGGRSVVLWLSSIPSKSSETDGSYPFAGSIGRRSLADEMLPCLDCERLLCCGE